MLVMLRLTPTWWGLLLLTVAVDAANITLDTQLYITAGVLGGIVLLLCCAVAFLMIAYVTIKGKVSRLQIAVDARNPQELHPIQGYKTRGVESTSHPPSSPLAQAEAPHYGQVGAASRNPQQGQHNYQPQQQRPHSAYSYPPPSAAPYGGQRPGHPMSQQPSYREPGNTAPGGGDPYSNAPPLRPQSSYFPDQRSRPPYSSDRY